MKKTYSLALITLFVLSGWLMAGCGQKEKTPSVAERIAKSWTAFKVDENTTTVFSRGGTTNVRPGYANWQLDLRSATSVTYKEWDGTSFTGTWSIVGENKLVLSGLTPQPTGSAGTIEFNISNLTETGLTLARTTTSQKTGGTINTYTLTNP
jgi:hypothetical protein